MQCMSTPAEHSTPLSFGEGLGVRLLGVRLLGVRLPYVYFHH